MKTLGLTNVVSQLERTKSQLAQYIEQDEGVGVEATQPMAYCRTIDIPNIAFGDTLNVSAIKDVDGNTLKAAQNYTVVNIQKDRTGFSALMLEEI